MDSAEQQVVDHLKQARNILVTVRNSPNVDLLSACIGLALGLDKLDKHVAAVFSGEVPSTLEFLKPEETIEQNPDSLRDFIIALDKSKADKLRYKVEDKVVRIFITPYKTSLSQSDLQFSQGDFNVDAVVALGAHEQQELDQAITSHGRILHDAAVISINNTPNGNLGSINWQDTTASSISELVTQLIKDLNKSTLDEQIATALLTGIVAETDRFSNEKTTPRTMSLAGDLMAAGANQQLVATQLQEEISPTVPDRPSSDVSTVLRDNPQDTNPETTKPEDGALEIDHKSQDGTENQTEQPENPAPVPELGQDRDMLPMPELPNSNNASEDPFISGFPKDSDKDDVTSVEHSYLVDESTPPDTELSGPGRNEPSTTNPFDMPKSELPVPLLARDDQTNNSAPPADEPKVSKLVLSDEPPVSTQFPPPPQSQPPIVTLNPLPSSAPEMTGETLEEIEESVHSPHLQTPSEPADVDNARQEVMQALQSSPPTIEPLTALNANPLGDELHSSSEQTGPQIHSNQVEIDNEGNLIAKSAPSAPALPPVDDAPDSATAMDMPLPPLTAVPNTSTTAFQPNVSSTSPPPVPPPFMPPPMQPG